MNNSMVEHPEEQPEAIPEAHLTGTSAKSEWPLLKRSPLNSRTGKMPLLIMMMMQMMRMMLLRKITSPLKLRDS